MGDDNIKKLCQDFYDRHKEVLDTIYENCKTSLNPICEVVEDWCRQKSEQGELIFSPQWSNNTYTRFTTETIRKLFPQHTKPIVAGKQQIWHFMKSSNAKTISKSRSHCAATI